MTFKFLDKRAKTIQRRVYSLQAGTFPFTFSILRGEYILKIDNFPNILLPEDAERISNILKALSVGNDRGLRM